MIENKMSKTNNIRFNAMYKPRVYGLKLFEMVFGIKIGYGFGLRSEAIREKNKNLEVKK